MSNSFHGMAIVGSIGATLPPTDSEAARECARRTTAGDRKEAVALIITSSWIPTHPSTHMVETTVNSTARLLGLSPTAPVFITVDFFPFTDFGFRTEERGALLEEKLKNLERYTLSLMELYLTDPRIHIVPAVQHLHIGGSVMKAMDLVERHYPSVRYLYYLQHDFYFTSDVDHAALVDGMRLRPDEVRYVLFPSKKHLGKPCGTHPPVVLNRTIAPDNQRGEIDATTGGGALTLRPTSTYSDNNHFVQFAWYKETIAALGFLQRPPEYPLQGRANMACHRGESLGLYLYPEPCIRHLDGRRHGASR